MCLSHSVRYNWIQHCGCVDVRAIKILCPHCRISLLFTARAFLSLSMKHFIFCVLHMCNTYALQYVLYIYICSLVELFVRRDIENHVNKILLFCVSCGLDTESGRRKFLYVC